jgi:hypothetical protein
MQGTYKLLNDNSIVFDNKSQPIGFLHPLNLQNINISLDFNVQTSDFGYYGLLKTNNMLAGIEVKPNLILANWVSVEPIWSSNTIPEIQSVLSRNVTLYETALTSYILYNFGISMLGKYYIMCFKLTNNTSNHNLLFCFRNETGLSFEYALSSTEATISYRNPKSGAWSYDSTDYTDLSSDGWNILVFEPTASGFYSWINDEPLHISGDYFSEGTYLIVTAPFYSNNNIGFHGYVTQLFSDISAPRIQTDRFFFFVNGSGNRSEVPLNSNALRITLSTTSDGSEVQIANYSYASSIPNLIIFGKLTAGDYGLVFTLNYMAIAQKAAGFYFTPVYFAVITPFFVAASTLLLLYNKKNVHSNSSEKIKFSSNVK